MARKLPKRVCCESRKRCSRCPIRMLKEGTLPAGYTVKKRKLIKLDDAAAKPAKGAGKKKRRAA